MSDQYPTPEEEKKSGFIRALSEPLSKYGWPSWLVYLLAIVGVIYLLNPTAGILEFLPDNLPYIGNLDETVAVMLVIAGIVELSEGKKYRQAKKNTSKEIAVEKKES
jgi:uncharacterized membrane protein YkvA (DUF1232 family)